MGLHLTVSESNGTEGLYLLSVMLPLCWSIIMSCPAHDDATEYQPPLFRWVGGPRIAGYEPLFRETGARHGLGTVALLTRQGSTTEQGCHQEARPREPSQSVPVPCVPTGCGLDVLAADDVRCQTREEACGGA